MSWEIVAMTAVLGGLGLGFYWLQTSARRLTSIEALAERVDHLERDVRGAAQPMPLPRGLPARGMR